jgi:hypothetical protein
VSEDARIEPKIFVYAGEPTAGRYLLYGRLHGDAPHRCPHLRDPNMVSIRVRMVIALLFPDFYM